MFFIAAQAEAELEQELEELRAKLQASEEKVTALESQRGADATLERLEAKSKSFALSHWM